MADLDDDINEEISVVEELWHLGEHLYQRGGLLGDSSTHTCSGNGEAVQKTLLDV